MTQFFFCTKCCRFGDFNTSLVEWSVFTSDAIEMSKEKPMEEQETD